MDKLLLFAGGAILGFVFMQTLVGALMFILLLVYIGWQFGG